MKIHKTRVAILLLLLFPLSCQLQTRQDNQEIIRQRKQRRAVVAGSFYPDNKQELIKLLDQCMAKAEPNKTSDEVLAILSPHAGYVFSGPVAASSFKQINKDMELDNIFVIGSSHHTRFDGASVYSEGNYLTPLGEVKVNIELADDLISKNDCFGFHPEAHSKEHSIEVQLPFLQHRLTQEFQIVPIIIGTQEAGRCREIAEVLLPYFNSQNLFVISTDFSHYPKYEDAVKVDKRTAAAVIANAPETFLKTLQENDQEGTDNLLTSMCGWSSVLTLLYMTEHMKDIEIIPIDYKNSGDTAYGDRSRVVGYHSICFTRKSDGISDYHLDQKDKEELLKIARSTIREYLRSHTIPEFNTKDFSKILLEPAGAFVTLKKDGTLRGCIGQFEPTQPLYQVVRDMSISSSTRDYRFLPLTPDELNEVAIEISVLSPMKKIDSIEEIVLGKHGIYIVQGSRSGTFLPQVATQTGWNLEEFLGHCSKDKAGIGWEGWKEADIYIYEAFVFEEE